MFSRVLEVAEPVARRLHRQIRRFPELAYEAASDAAEFLFPAVCIECGDYVDGGSWAPMLCRACADGFVFWDARIPVPPPLDGGHSLARFEGPARRLLIDLKFRGLLRAGAALGSAMAIAPDARAFLTTSDLVVPIPLHWRRRWLRGHSQAAVLARAMRRHGGLPELRNALRRRRATRPQVGLDRKARQANLEGAFVVPEGERSRVSGAAVVLIDDVVTTGATAAAGANALKQAGARRVTLCVAAWADAPIVQDPVAHQCQ